MPAWYDLALADLGTKEGAGAKDNPKVVAYYADAGFPGTKHDSVAWCAAFVGAKLRLTGIKPSGSLMARSYLTWGSKLATPKKGCIVVFWRGSKTAATGHVAFYHSDAGTSIKVLGGNQSDAVNIASYAKSKVLGYRWPSNVPAEIEVTPAQPKTDSPPVPRTPIINQGDTGEAVREAQQLLAARGYTLDVDGVFGSRTDKVVRSFQRSSGMDVDGDVGPKTWAALRGRVTPTSPMTAEAPKPAPKVVLVTKPASGPPAKLQAPPPAVKASVIIPEPSTGSNVMRKILWPAALALLALAAAVTGASAEVVVAPENTIVIPWGGWAQLVLSNLTEVALAVVAAFAAYAAQQVPVLLRPFVNNKRVETLIRNAVLSSLAKVGDAVAGKQLTVQVNSEVLRYALQYALQHAGPGLIKWMGNSLPMVVDKILAQMVALGVVGADFDLNAAAEAVRTAPHTPEQAHEEGRDAFGGDGLDAAVRMR